MPSRSRTAILALVLAAGPGPGCSPAPRPDPEQRGGHVVLISVDTLRADHLGCYGNPTVRTPAIDALAAEGIRLCDLTATAPTTLASHLSLFTGNYPHTHGIVRNGWTVNPANQTLAELMRMAGYRTVAVIGSFALSSITGFDQGFDHYDEDFDERIRFQDVEPNQRRAASTTDAAIALLDDLGDESLFLFLHYFDPHHPYDPPAPYDTMYLPAAAGIVGDLRDQRRAVAAQQKAITGREEGLDNVIVHGLSRQLVTGCDGVPRDIDPLLAARYAGEVSYVDEHVGRVFDELKRRGMWESSLVIFTSDHGETFWEHGDFWNHGLCVYDTTVQIPLILKLPGGEGAGGEIATPLSNVDLLPTLVELLGLAEPERVEGRSFLAALEGRPLEPAPVFSGATQPARQEREGMVWLGERKSKAVRQGRFKLVRTPYLELDELYDLAADPGERRNLLMGGDAAARDRAEGMRAVLEGWADSAGPLTSGFNYQYFQEMKKQLEDGEVSDRLQGLGYAGAGEEEEKPESGGGGDR